MITLATWNVNSIRIREAMLRTFLAVQPVDVLCVQETKVEDHAFPHDMIRGLGFSHAIISGQKSYHGVAILSKLPLTLHSTYDVLGNNEKRHISAQLPCGLVVHNFYVPAGGDIPDVSQNPKFADKLKFMDWLTEFSSRLPKTSRTLLVGDLNIAPHEHDVWSSKQLRNVVSHTDIEREKMLAAIKVGSWVDVPRQFFPASEKLYSWWSYRNRDWKASNRGRRLDHIWATPALAPEISNFSAHPETRDYETTSDHVPLVVTMGA